MDTRHGEDPTRRSGERRVSRPRSVPLAAALLTSLLLICLFGAVAPAGAITAPGKPAAKTPSSISTITTTKPIFTWGKAARATRYEVRVYQGGTLRLRKTGITKLSWKSTTALAKDVGLTWKVRAGNAAGNGVWSKSPAFKVISLAIGDAYRGGKVAYILQSGDPGYVAGLTHGLIAASADQTVAMHWYNGSFTATGATATALGTGRANTDTIVAAQGPTATSYAAGLAQAFTGGGYTDWYLPSKDELNTLFVNQAAIGGFDLTPGGSPAWGAGPYWSSTEVGTDFAWAQYFSAGVQLTYPAGVQHVDYKSGADYRVRAVRSF
jgi:hypothetical protein